MANNIVRLTIRSVKDFRLGLLPIAQLFDRYQDSEVQVPFVKPLMISFIGVCEVGVIEGLVVEPVATDGGMTYSLSVTRIEWWGVSSGSTFDELRELLKTGRGEMVVRVVWDGGDVEDLTFNNGQMTRVMV